MAPSGDTAWGMPFFCTAKAAKSLCKLNNIQNLHFLKLSQIESCCFIQVQNERIKTVCVSWQTTKRGARNARRSTKLKYRFKNLSGLVSCVLEVTLQGHRRAVPPAISCLLLSPRSESRRICRLWPRQQQHRRPVAKQPARWRPRPPAQTLAACDSRPNRFAPSR